MNNIISSLTWSTSDQFLICTSKPMVNNFDQKEAFIEKHCVKSVQIRSCHWYVLGLNTEIYGVNLHNQLEYRQIWTRTNTPYLGTFHAVEIKHE